MSILLFLKICDEVTWQPLVILFEPPPPMLISV